VMPGAACPRQRHLPACQPSPRRMGAPLKPAKSAPAWSSSDGLGGEGTEAGLSGVHNRYVVYNVDSAIRSGNRTAGPGDPRSRWEEIEARFGWTLRRRQLLDGLAEGLALLADAGCTLVWVNGSFVAAKDEPGDFDCVWSTAGVDRATLQRWTPELLDFSNTVRLRGPASEASSSPTSSRP